jgi:phosphoserine phosphatase RsbU/P
VAMVTDGVTEALSPDDREFGDERVCEALRGLSGGTASSVLEGLVKAVNAWVGPAGCSDDLTALILKAR